MHFFHSILRAFPGGKFCFKLYFSFLCNLKLQMVTLERLFMFTNLMNTRAYRDTWHNPTENLQSHPVGYIVNCWADLSYS